MKNKNILLLNDFMQEGQHWNQFISKLESLLPEHHILTLDLPGNGKHYKLRSFLSIGKNVHFLRDQWKKRIDYPSDNTLVAISMGGMIALEWSMHFPEDWKKVIAINTSSGALSPFYQRYNLKNFLRIIFSLVMPSEKRRQELHYFLTVNDVHRKKRTVERWMQIAKTHPIKIKNALRQFWASMTFRKISAQASVPTYFICSRTDRLINPICGEQIAKYWNCPISYHETAGHDPTVEATDWLAEKIQNIILNT